MRQSASEARASRAIAALVCGAIGISLAAIFVRLREEGTGLSATAFWRLALALPLFWGWRLAERRRQRAATSWPSPRQAMVLMLPGVFFAADLAVWHWSIALTSVANATLFANCAPIPVALVAWLWLRERLRVPFFIGLAFGLLGAGLILRASSEAGATSVSGDALGLLTAVFYGGYILSVKNVRGSYSTARVMSWNMPVACVVLMAVALASGERLAPQTPRGWLVLVGLALVCQVGGQGLIAYALAHLPASFSAVSLLVQPVAAAVFAWALLGEPLGLLQGAGGVLVLAGVFLARMGSSAGRPGP